MTKKNPQDNTLFTIVAILFWFGIICLYMYIMSSGSQQECWRDLC